MFKYEFINDNDRNEYQIEYHYVYDIINSSPVEINVYKRIKNDKGSIINSKHALRTIILEKDEIECIQNFIDIPEEIKDYLSKRFKDIITWRKNFNIFLEENNWFIQKECQLAAKAFDIYILLYVLNYKNIKIRPSWDDTESKVEVTKGETEYSLNVSIKFDYILITATSDDNQTLLFIRVYPEKIIFSNLFNEIIYDKKILDIDTLKSKLKELSDSVPKLEISEEIMNNFRERIEELAKKNG